MMPSHGLLCSSGQPYERPVPTYAGPLRILDADSHIMEIPDWLGEFADSRTNEILKPLLLGKAGAMAERSVAAAAQRSRAGRLVDDETLSTELMRLKGWKPTDHWTRRSADECSTTWASKPNSCSLRLPRCSKMGRCTTSF